MITTPLPAEDTNNPHRFGFFTTAGLIGLSVLLLSLAFAPAGQFYLAWVALVPFFIALRQARSQVRAMLWGWFGGIAFFIANMWWLSSVTWPGMFALMAYLGLYWGFAAMLVRGCSLIDRPRIIAGALLAGAVWTSLDWIRGSYSMFGAHGLPWLYLGDTQTPWLAICQIADITGVYGVTFLIVFVNAVVTWIVAGRLAGKRRELLTPSPGTPGEGRGEGAFDSRTASEIRNHPHPNPLPVYRERGPIFCTLALLIGVELYGQFRLHQQTQFAGPTVLVVQPNYPQSNTGEHPVPTKTIIDFHTGITKKALAECQQRGQKVDLVAWSETMMPPLNMESRRFLRGYNDAGEYASQQISNLAFTFRTSFLVGATYGNDYRSVTTPDGDYAEPSDRRNCAYFFNDAGLLSDSRYDKIKLLLFGETMPFHESLPWLSQKLVALGPPDVATYQLVAGQPDALTTFSFDSQDGREAAYRFVVPICFEDIVSPVVTDLMRTRAGETGSESNPHKRADFLINITNDGWFGGGERAQHLQAAVFRSIENRVPTARSVNTGISGFIDSEGRTSDLLHESTEGWSVHQLMLDHRVAVHTQIGELFAVLCATITGLSIVYGLTVGWRRGGD